MRRPRTGLHVKRLQWVDIATRLGARLAEVPHLAAQHAILAGLIAESHDLEGDIARQKAKIARFYTRLDEVASAAEELRGRLTANLQGEFGFKSPELYAYGLRPRRTRGRRRKGVVLAAAAPGEVEPVVEPVE